MDNDPKSPTTGTEDISFTTKQQFILDHLKSKYGSQVDVDAIFKEFTEATTMENKMKIVAKFKSMLGPDNAHDRNFRLVKDKVNFKCKHGSEKFRTEGNEAYRKGENKKALILYTQSIANAPTDSVELALAYANRSAVLRSMQKCRECLVDIERALSHGYPTDKSFKLLLRELQCHRDLRNMLKAQVMFCSEMCQREANQKYHNTECAPYSIFRQTRAVSPNSMEHLLDRVFRLFAIIGIHNLKPYLKYARTDINQESTMTNEEKRTKGFNADRIFDPNNFDTIFNLCYKFPDSPSEFINSWSALQVPCSFGMSKSNPDFFAVSGLFMQLMFAALMNGINKFYTNFDFPPITCTIVATLFSPLNSLLNHSCVSNTTRVEYNNKHVVVAKWPIAKGTILTEPYVDIDNEWSKEQRQKKVKQDQSFDCKCVPCEENWNFKEKRKISDPDDQKLASEIVARVNGTVLIDLQRNFLCSPEIKIPKFESFVNDRRDFLTRMWEKGEFLASPCIQMQCELDIHNFLQGNRVISTFN
ncbi:hypothetical protein B566_EDAN015693 [Ephemera danica]|nr:hypothetical protein B566_EDAN015693 [Ephemera danica]